MNYLDICEDLIVENILAMFDPDCNEKSCRAVAAEYGSRPLASGQVEGKVRVYSGCTVDMYTCTAARDNECSHFLSAWLMVSLGQTRIEARKKNPAARKQTIIIAKINLCNFSRLFSIFVFNKLKLTNFGMS